MNESTTLKGLPRTRIVSQTSPAPVAHPTSRSRLEYDKAKAATIGRDDSLVDRFCAAGEAGHPTLRRQSVSPVDQYAKHAVVLDPDEYADRRREHGDARSRAPMPSQPRMGVRSAASNATPAMTKTSWVAAPTVMSTTMLAVACAPGTPR